MFFWEENRTLHIVSDICQNDIMQYLLQTGVEPFAKDYVYLVYSVYTCCQGSTAEEEINESTK